MINKLVLSILIFTLSLCSFAMEEQNTLLSSNNSAASIDSNTVPKHDAFDDLLNKIKRKYTGKDTDSVHEIAKTLINNGKGIRNIESQDTDGKYGKTFPINPQILSELIDIVDGKRVLEIAGAAGENSLLLAIAGASSVTLNDIEPRELDKAREFAQKLPPAIRSKLNFVEGDCLKVLTQKKKNRNKKKFDIIIARNILHFFADKDRDAFINVVTRLLSPNGKIVILVNSIHSAIAQDHLPKNFLETNPDTYMYRSDTLQLYSLVDGQMLMSCGTVLSPMKADQIFTPFSHNRFPVLSLVKTSRGFSYQSSNGVEQKLIAKAKGFFELIFKEKENDIRKFAEHNVTFFSISGFTGAYAQSTLSNLFKSHGFTIVKSFAVDSSGVLSPIETATQIGIIATINQ